MKTVTEKCEWHPEFHNGKQCPIHGSGGLVERYDDQINRIKAGLRAKVEQILKNGEEDKNFIFDLLKDPHKLGIAIDMVYNTRCFEEWYKNAVKYQSAYREIFGELYENKYEKLDRLGADYFSYDEVTGKLNVYDLKTVTGENPLHIQPGQFTNLCKGNCVTGVFVIQYLTSSLPIHGASTFNKDNIEMNVSPSEKVKIIDANKFYQEYVEPVFMEKGIKNIGKLYKGNLYKLGFVPASQYQRNRFLLKSNDGTATIEVVLKDNGYREIGFIIDNTKIFS